jgi:hypothetical protein
LTRKARRIAGQALRRIAGIVAAAMVATIVTIQLDPSGLLFLLLVGGATGAGLDRLYLRHRRRRQSRQGPRTSAGRRPGRAPRQRPTAGGANRPGPRGKATT